MEICSGDPISVPVKYPGDRVGPPLNLSLNNAFGIIREIALAGTAPAWETEMSAYIKKHKAIHPDVIEFYSMGDMPLGEDGTPSMRSNWMSDDSGPTVDFDAYIQTLKKAADMKEVENRFHLKKADQLLTADNNIATIVDCSQFAHEIRVSWTWGMRFLFQGFSLRKQGAGKKAEWHLWPFTQPDMNNRQINVDQYLWNELNPTPDQMIPQIFEKGGNEFSIQGVYSVPYIIQTAEADDGGIPLHGMVEGVSLDDSDDFKFSDLSALKITEDAMDQCFEALTVRLLFSSISCLPKWNICPNLFNSGYCSNRHVHL